jgi:hypothetical protein
MEAPGSRVLDLGGHALSDKVTGRGPRAPGECAAFVGFVPPSTRLTSSK